MANREKFGWRSLEYDTVDVLGRITTERILDIWPTFFLSLALPYNSNSTSSPT